MKTQETIIVGAGLAGSLLAIYLAQKGFKVRVYERRPDLRKANISAGRSINLALSTRGIYALNEVGVLEKVMRDAIPMRGRMIHSPEGEIAFQQYGKDPSEAIYQPRERRARACGRGGYVWVRWRILRHTLGNAEVRSV